MPHALPTQFRNELLRDALRTRGLTQERFAREADVKLGTVSRWVRGLSEPRGAELVALIRVLGGTAADWYRA